MLMTVCCLSGSTSIVIISWSNSMSPNLEYNFRAARLSYRTFKSTYDIETPFSCVSSTVHSMASHMRFVQTFRRRQAGSTYTAPTRYWPMAGFWAATRWVVVSCRKGWVTTTRNATHRVSVLSVSNATQCCAAGSRWRSSQNSWGWFTSCVNEDRKLFGSFCSDSSRSFFS